MDKPDITDIEIIFCKHYQVKDIKGDITDKICIAINKIVKWQALGAQKFNGVWVIAVRSPEARTTLLSSTLMIDGYEIKLYGDNPYTMAENRERSERVVFKGLPFWEPSSMIKDYVDSVPHLFPVSDDIHFSKARNAEGGRSKFLNGDRYIFVKPDIDPPLPERVNIGPYSCRIWYQSRDLKCKRCGENHNTNDADRCDSYTTPLPNIHIFTGGSFSNFQRCKVNMGPLSFPTSEHAYQFRACEEHLRADLAELVLKASTPREAKSIASEIKSDDPSSNWNLMKYEVMREVLQAKIESSPKFKQELLDSNDQLLVEASATDTFWGSGLTYNLSLTTLPDKFPGKNMLGKLLMQLRAEVRAQQLITKTAPEAVPKESSSMTLAPPESEISVPIVRPTRPAASIKAKQRASTGTGSGKSPRPTSTPLIRDMFKRKRVDSPPHGASSAADVSSVDDDVMSESSFGSCNDSEDKLLTDFSTSSKAPAVNI